MALRSLLNLTFGGSLGQFLLPAFFLSIWVILSYFFAWLVISGWKLDILYNILATLDIGLPCPSQGL